MSPANPKLILIDKEQLDGALLQLRSGLCELWPLTHDDSRDLRCVIVGNLVLQCEVTASVLRMVWPLLQNPRRAAELGLLVSMQTREAIVLRTISEQAKTNLVLNWMFQLDHFSGQLAARLGVGQSSHAGGFDYVNLFASLRINAPAKRAKALRVLQLIRNSLHNNGVHGKSSRSLTSNGRQYRFRKGAVVMCAAWDRLFPLFQSSVDSLGHILKHPRVVGAGYLPDDFAARVGQRQLNNFNAWQASRCT